MKLSELKPICGVYKITNLENGRVYVGQSLNVMLRWASHVDSLVSGRHSNPALLTDFRRYGIDAFVVELIETCRKGVLLRREEFYISKYFQEGYDLYNNILRRYGLPRETSARWTIGWTPADDTNADPTWSGVPFDSYDEAGRAVQMLRSVDPGNDYFVVDIG